MRAANLTLGAICLAIAGFLVWKAFGLKIEGDTGPRPGFFPLIIGLGLGGLSLAWLGRELLGRGSEGAIAIEDGEVRGILVMLVALAVFMAMLRPLGFNLAMLVLLLVLFFRSGREHALVKLVLAVVSSFGIHAVFEKFLKVPLPFSSIPFLRDLGL